MSNLLRASNLIATTVTARPDQVAPFHDALEQLVEAHRLGGRELHTYSVHTGIGGQVLLLQPIGAISELDGWDHLDELVSESLSERESASLRAGLRTGVQDMRTEVLQLASTASPGAVNGISPYLLHQEIVFRTDRVDAFKAALVFRAAAHREHPEGLSFSVYAPHTGRVDRVHAFVPFSSFAEMATWKDEGEINRYGPGLGDSTVSIRSTIYQRMERGSAHGGAYFEVYRDKSGDYRFRFRAADGEILATGGQGFETRAACLADLDRVRGLAPSAPTVG